MSFYGLLGVVALGGAATAFQAHFMGIMDKRIGTLESVFITYSGGGLLIGIMEEFFFRGFIFTALRDKVFRGSIRFAMVVTSLFYASIHFVNIRKPVISQDPGFLDSLKMIAAPLQSFADWQAVWPAAIGLFLFGMVLNYCVVRTKSLYA